MHPQSKTQAIFKSSFIGSRDGADEICISAFSYDIIPRIDLVPMHGGDGRWHDVPVPWDEYIPLEANNNFYVTTADFTKSKNIMAQRDNLCIFN